MYEDKNEVLLSSINDAATIPTNLKLLTPQLFTLVESDYSKGDIDTKFITS